MIAINNDQHLPSQMLAESINTNAAFVRQIMSKLKKAELIMSIHGHAKPTLARSSHEITLLDVYHAIEGNKPLLHLDTHTNPECGIGVNIQYALQDYYDEVQKVAEEKMSMITLEDIIQNFYHKSQLYKE